MVLLTTTPAMVSAQQYVLDCDSLADGPDPGAEPLAAAPQVGIPISHEGVLQLARHVKDLKQKTGDNIEKTAPSHNLDELLRGSRVYVERPSSKTEPVRPQLFL